MWFIFRDPYDGHQDDDDDESSKKQKKKDKPNYIDIDLGLSAYANARRYSSFDITQVK